MYRISALIENECKRQGIDYTSPYHDKILDYQADINELVKMYLELKEIIGKLSEIEDKYQISGMANLIEKDIKMLSKIDHDIMAEVHKIIRRKEKNEKDK